MHKLNTLNNYSIRTTGFFNIIFIVTVLFLLANKTTAQPFLDIAKLKYSNSPNTGLLNQNKNDVKLRYFSFETNLPIQFNNKKDALIFSPFFENWYSQINNTRRQNYYSVALPVTLSKTIPYTKWAVLLTGIVRMNDSSINKKTKMQVGGAFIVSNKRNERCSRFFFIDINYFNGKLTGKCNKKQYNP